MAISIPSTADNVRVWFYDQSAGTYTERASYGNNQDLFTDDATTGDAMVFFLNSGQNAVEYLQLNLNTALAATSISLVWEVPTTTTASTWSSTVIKVADATNSFRETGQRRVAIQFLAGQRGWITGMPGAAGRYIRARISAVSGLTEGGHQSATNCISHRWEILVTALDNTFDTIYTADLAGTRNLMFPTTCKTGLIPLNPFPCEQGALRVSCILTGTTAGAGDTIGITGTDSEGGAISESIDVSAGNGTYVSIKSYKTITTIDCNGWTDGTIEVTQGRWGVLGKTENSYQLYTRLVIGDGTTTTTFADTMKDIQIMKGISCASSFNYIRGAAKSTITFGTAVDATDKIAGNGCRFSLLEDVEAYLEIIYSIGGTTSDTFLYLYGCSFVSTMQSARVKAMNAAMRVWGCQFNKNVAVLQSNSVDIFQHVITNTSEGMFDLSNPTGTYVVQNMFIANCSSGIYAISAPYKVRDVQIINCTIPVKQYGTPTDEYYLIDCTVDSWTNMYVVASRKIVRQYSVNLKVVDALGDPIEGATVSLIDKDDAQVFSTITSAAGVITEQIVTYAQYSKVSGAGTFDTTVLSSPHTLSISKQGYQTYISTLTIDKKLDSVLTLNRAVDVILSKGQIAVNADPSNPVSDIFV